MAQAVRHVVVLRFNDHITADQVTTIAGRFRALKDKIPGITAFEYGENNSTEGANRGLTHVFLLTFEDAAARDAYLPHPDHLAFVEYMTSETNALGEAFIIDYPINE